MKNRILKRHYKKIGSIVTLFAMTVTILCGGGGFRTGAESIGAPASTPSSTILGTEPLVPEVTGADTAALPVPGKIEAEDYTAQSGVQTENCSSGTLDVCGIDSGDSMSYDVNVASSGSYWVDVCYAAKSPTGTFDLKSGDTVLATMTPTTTDGDQTYATQTAIVDLSSGEQTLSIVSNGSGFQLDSLDITFRSASTTIANGSVQPYTQCEAESGTYKGQLLATSRTLYTQAAEASGREAVKLSAKGNNVQWKTTQATDAIDIRNCIPDSAKGGGQTATIDLYVNGVLKKAITLSSQNTWLYGTTDTDTALSNSPSSSTYARHYYDDARNYLGFTIPAGATVKLQKDSGNKAAYYIIDFVDFEMAAPAIAQPANTLSVTKYGAVANNGKDDTTAIQNCVKAAEAQGKGVYIPSGIFVENEPIYLAKPITIQGAGMWRTSLTQTAPTYGSNYITFAGASSGIVISDLAVIGNETNRTSGGGAFSGYFGPGSQWNNVWVEHTNTGAWIGSSLGITDGLLVQGCRFWDTYADGINLCNSSKNTIVRNCISRGNGDDGFATWSATDMSPDPCQNNNFISDTSELQWRANGFAIYGGKNNSIRYCLASDTLTYAGVDISSSFTPYQFAGSTTVSNVTLIRCGGAFFGNQHYGALWVEAHYSPIVGLSISNVDIEDATYAGIELSSTNYDHAAEPMTVQMSNINMSGTGYYPPAGQTGSCDAIYVQPATIGSVAITGLTYKNAKQGYLSNPASAANFKLTIQ